MKTQEEYNIERSIRPILAELNIKKRMPGYSPLIDFISYAGAFPNISLEEALQKLVKENRWISTPYLLENMVLCIETALEDVNEAKLERVGMSSTIIRTILDETCCKESLIEVLGEKYERYTHEQIILFFFTKKILKSIPMVQIEEVTKQIRERINDDVIYKIMSSRHDLNTMTDEQIREEVKLIVKEVIDET